MAPKQEVDNGRRCFKLSVFNIDRILSDTCKTNKR